MGNEGSGGWPAVPIELTAEEREELERVSRLRIASAAHGAGSARVDVPVGLPACLEPPFVRIGAHAYNERRPHQALGLVLPRPGRHLS